MILSFKDRETKVVYDSGKNRIYAAISRTAIRKIIQIDEAITLSDLAVPPGNHLEALKGNRLGQHFIPPNRRDLLCVPHPAQCGFVAPFLPLICLRCPPAMPSRSFLIIDENLPPRWRDDLARFSSRSTPLDSLLFFK